MDPQRAINLNMLIHHFGRPYSSHYLEKDSFDPYSNGIAITIVFAVFLIVAYMLWKLYRFNLHLNAESCRRRFADNPDSFFALSDENGETRNFSEFFVIEPSGEDGQVRSQIDKEEKDLPTYEEVMAATLAASAASFEQANRAHDNRVAQRATSDHTCIEISSSNLSLPVPPYVEIDPFPIPSAVPNNRMSSTLEGSNEACGLISPGLNSDFSGPSTSHSSCFSNAGQNE